MKSHKGSKDIALLFLELRHWMAGLAKTTSRLFYTVKETHRSLGGPQVWSGRLRKISPTPGLDRRTLHSAVSRYTDCSKPTKANLEISNKRGKVGIT